MRRLPVYFLLDCSESMVGERQALMEQGLQGVVRGLRTDPHALETVFISVIAFAGVAKTIAPLVELPSFYQPRLPVGSGTDLAAGLDELMRSIDRSVVKTTREQKGDWKPIVYLLTDGKPTKDVSVAVSRWKQSYASKASMVAVGIGQAADLSVLRNLTDDVLSLDSSAEVDLKKFFTWITASVTAYSKSIQEGDSRGAVKGIDVTIMSLVKSATRNVGQDQTLCLSGRCQKSKRPYLIKYEKERQDTAGTRDFSVEVGEYGMAGCFALDEDYFAWSDGAAAELEVNTTQLRGTPSCPHCGAGTAFAVCSCGKLMCASSMGEATCPWCNKTLTFKPVSLDEGGIDVQRGMG
jgi:uncharacterized protein YegL